jgi:hypothetical protein
LRVAWCVLVLAALLVAEGASATTAGGMSARLLAFAGRGQRYAVILEEATDAGCSGDEPCLLYAVDTESAEFRRLWPVVYTPVEPPLVSNQLPRGLTTLDHYAAFVKALTPARAALLVPRGPIASHHGDEDGPEEVLAPVGVLFAPNGDNPENPTWMVHGHRIEARLRSLGTFDSMSKVDAVGGRPCDLSCSNCTRVTLWSDGARRQSISCKNGVGFRKGPEGQQEQCRCHGRGAASVLELHDRTVSRRAVGSKILASPYRMNDDFPLPRIDLSFPHGSLDAYLNSKGTLLVVGAAMHAPQANSTDFPAIAVYRVPGARPAKAPVDAEITWDRGRQAQRPEAWRFVRGGVHRLRGSSRSHGRGRGDRSRADRRRVDRPPHSGDRLRGDR